MSSRNIFFSPVQPNYFLQDSESKYFFWKKNIKLKLNSLRGKLIKIFAKPKWFSHIPTKKRNKTVVIKNFHEKIFPSKIRLFFISQS